MLNVRYKKFIQAALVIGPMTMLMALVGVLRNYGWHNGWFVKVALTWITMFPIAYCFSLIVIPVANKVISKIDFKE